MACALTSVARLRGLSARWSFAPSQHAHARILNVGSFSTAVNCGVAYEKKTASFAKGEATRSRRPAQGDPTGRRRKDRVPDDYELIASSELVAHKFFTIANFATQGAWLLALYRFSIDFLPQVLYRGPYDSVMTVVFMSDQNLMIATAFPMVSLTLTIFRVIFNRYLLRLYLNRETENYCAVYLGWFRMRRIFFTHKDVRLIPTNSKLKCELYLKGNPTLLDIEEFRNIRDYNQMLRYAKKLQM